MKENIKVSVIIPFFGNKEWLFESIESALNQTYKDIEIILVNDGHPGIDENEISKAYPSVSYYFQENSGVSIARNFGIKESTGEYIAFLDADDLWSKSKIEVQLTAMIESNSQWSHTNFEYFGASDSIVDVSLYQGNVFPISMVSNPIATPTVMIKKDLLIENNIWFEENIKLAEDTVLWAKLSMQSDLLNIPENLTSVRDRGSNSAKIINNQIQGRTNIWNFFYLKLNEADRDAINSKVKIAYKICLTIEKHITGSKFNQLINKGLYLLPWVIFKSEGKKFYVSSKARVDESIEELV